MLAEALQAEVDAYIAQFADQRDGAGRRLGGAQQLRPATGGAHQRQPVEVVAPRVNDRWVDPDTGQRRRFISAILPVGPQDPEDHRGAAAAVPTPGSRPETSCLRSGSSWALRPGCRGR